MNHHHHQPLVMTTMSSSFNTSTTLTQVATDYALILVQEGWKWICKRLEVSHLVAAFIFFWWSRRQPKRSRKTKNSRQQLLQTAGGLKRWSSSSILSDDDLWDTCAENSSSNTTTGNGDASSSSLSTASLLPSFPTSTRQERQRFLSTNKGNVRKAVAQLQAYLQWRHKHALIEHELRPWLKVPQNNSDDDGDAVDWIIATAVAMQAHGNNSKSTTNIQPQQVPQVARMHNTLPDTASGRKLPCLDRNGHRMIHLTPGRMAGIPLKTYATAIALYIDRKLVTDSTERVVLVIDVRGGIGWPNRNGAQLLPFMQHIIPLLLQHFPDRLAQCIVFPVPPNFEWVWKIVRNVCLDAATANSIQVVTGPAFKECPPPYAKLDVFVEERIVRHWEELRKAAFILGDENNIDGNMKKQ